MKPETVLLLCNPGTHEPLRLASAPTSDGSVQEVLVGVHSGQTYPIRAGIPVLLDESQVVGYNHQYQRFYNRIAGVYDSVMGLFALLAGGGEAHFRGEYLRQVETRDGSGTLEVSIGTGTNLRYLPGQSAYLLTNGHLLRCGFVKSGALSGGGEGGRLEEYDWNGNLVW